MTNQSKENYIKLIHDIWPALSAYTADDVNEDAAGVADYVINELVRTCKPIALFSGTMSAIVELMKVKQPHELSDELYKQLHLLITGLSSSRRYRVILNAAALKNRSAMEIALMDI